MRKTEKAGASFAPAYCVCYRGKDQRGPPPCPPSPQPPRAPPPPGPGPQNQGAQTQPPSMVSRSAAPSSVVSRFMVNLMQRNGKRSSEAALNYASLPSAVRQLQQKMLLPQARLGLSQIRARAPCPCAATPNGSGSPAGAPQSPAAAKRAWRYGHRRQVTDENIRFSRKTASWPRSF